MATAISRTSATVGHGGTSNLQRFQAHHPPTYIGGGDSMVRIALAIEREVDDTRSIRDMGSSAKRKENQSSSSSMKKQKTSASHGFQRQSRGYPGQGQTRVSSQSEHMTRYFYHQPGHKRQDCPQRQGSQGFGIAQSQSSLRQARKQFIPPHPNVGQRNQYQSQGAAQAPSTTLTGQGAIQAPSTTLACN